MTFGERLYQLRKEKNLSQEELAEQLNVSRQSVSRWENGSAAPDFEKTVRLSEIFEVTTDYLIKGGDASQTAPDEKTVKTEASLPAWRKVIAAVLFLLGGISVLYGLFFGGWLDYYIFVSLPLLILGALFLFSKKRLSLRVLWTVYLSVTNLLYVSFSWHWSTAFLIFRRPEPAFQRYIYSGWALLLLMLIMVLYTARSLRKNFIFKPKRHLLLLLLTPVCYLLSELLTHLLSEPLLNLVLTQSFLFQFINILLSLLRLAIITAFAVLLAQWRFHKK